jgi:predicted kinase
MENKKVKELIIIRGLPGAGKSTLAKTIGVTEHYEADMYFVAPDGSYQFDVTRIKDAHQWCKDLVMMAMKREEPKVVVSNTFTQEWEMQPYYEMAEKYGYRVYSLIVENRHGGVNEHGVPDDKLEQMRNRFEIKL